MPSTSTALLTLLALTLTAPTALAAPNPPSRPSWTFSSPSSWGWGKPADAPAPAWPSPAWPAPSGSPTACVSDAQATVIANQFAGLISNYSVVVAEAVLSDEYFDQADSVNTLIDGGGVVPLALGSPTFATKAAFLAGQGSQPNVPFEILHVWHTCDTVLLRWVSKQLPQQVQGFDALEVVPQLNQTLVETYGPWQINTTYGEFNSGAWLVDIGCSISCPPPPSRMMAM